MKTAVSSKLHYFLKPKMKHFLQNHLRIFILAVTPMLLSACGSDDRGGYSCAAVVDPYGAVRLIAKDTNGLPLAGYEVTYQRIDVAYSTAIQKIVCESTEECALTGGGGEYSITINKTGFEPTSLKVTVRSEFCSVYTEKVAVTLKSLN